MRTLSFALVCLAPGAALAQINPPSPAPSLTMAVAVSLAVRQNPRLLGAAHDLAAARSGVRSARALSNPQLTFTPALTPGGSDEELLFQQPLELNGTRSARAGVARAQLRQTQAEARGALQRVIFETQSAYLQLTRTRELLQLAQAQLHAAEELDRITRSQVESGTRPGIDRTQSAIEMTRAQQQVTLAESRVAEAIGTLNTLLGRAPREGVGSLDLPNFPPVADERDALVQQALEARTEIEAGKASQEAALQEARLARAQGRPDLAPQLRGGNLTRGAATPGIGLGVTLPFLDYGSRRNRIRQAEEIARAEAARVEAVRAQVRQEVEAAHSRLRAAEAVRASYQQGVLAQAQRLVTASRTGLEAGLTSLLEVLEAQRTQRAVLTEYANARIDAALAWVELERALGAIPADLPQSPAGQGGTP